eukprot:GHVT01025100.1.p2 GENE.GHVT01025100.1~~GHVT01025100.1.p2  ORF type:complete len:140 (-),score=10.63 GHVT01025100.1:1446-1865(-)
MLRQTRENIEYYRYKTMGGLHAAFHQNCNTPCTAIGNIRTPAGVTGNKTEVRFSGKAAFPSHIPINIRSATQLKQSTGFSPKLSNARLYHDTMCLLLNVERVIAQQSKRLLHLVNVPRVTAYVQTEVVHLLTFCKKRNS